MILINRTALVSPAQATSNLARIAPASQNPPPPPSPAATTVATAKPATQFAFSDTPKLSKSLTANFDQARRPSALALAPDHTPSADPLASRPWNGGAKTAPWRPYSSAIATPGASRNAVPTPYLTYGVTGNPGTARQGFASATQLYVKGTGDAHEVSLDDIRQGKIANCYLLAAMGAVAMQDPQAIKNMIRENFDGTYTVTFKQRISNDPVQYQDVPVTVTANFPGGVGGTGHVKHGDTADDNRKEIWPLLIEKAYAQWRGGYEAIGNGGDARLALEHLTGRPPVANANSLTDCEVAASLQQGKAVVMAAGPADKVLASFGLVGDHVYTVTGIQRDGSGQSFLLLRNPWGNTDPKPIPFEQLKDPSRFGLYMS